MLLHPEGWRVEVLHRTSTCNTSKHRVSTWIVDIMMLHRTREVGGSIDRVIHYRSLLPHIHRILLEKHPVTLVWGLRRGRSRREGRRRRRIIICRCEGGAHRGMVIHRKWAMVHEWRSGWGEGEVLLEWTGGM